MGALDGKHIAIKWPENCGSGSLFYSYKGFNSFVLMALVDVDYKFILVDLGANDSAFDAAIFHHSEMKGVIENDTIGFPLVDLLSNDDDALFLSEMMLFL